MEICSPQLEKGHTRIANELLEAITFYPFNATELKIILTIIRKTYGWKQKTAYISYGLLSKLTGIDKRYIRRVLNKLVQDKVVLKEKNSGSNILGLNKHYLQWKLWITLTDRGLLAPVLEVNKPLYKGQQTPESRGEKYPILNKEINIYKENIKEKGNFYPQPRHSVHIKEVIKAIT